MGIYDNKVSKKELVIESYAELHDIKKVLFGKLGKKYKILFLKDGVEVSDCTNKDNYNQILVSKNKFQKTIITTIHNNIIDNSSIQKETILHFERLIPNKFYAIIYKKFATFGYKLIDRVYGCNINFEQEIIAVINTKYELTIREDKVSNIIKISMNTEPSFSFLNHPSTTN